MDRLHRHILFAEGDFGDVGKVCFFWIVFFSASQQGARRRALNYRKSKLFTYAIVHHAKRLGVQTYRIHSRSLTNAVERGDIIEQELRLDGTIAKSLGE